MKFLFISSLNLSEELHSGPKSLLARHRRKNQNFQMFLNVFKINYQIALAFLKEILQTK